MTLAQTPPHDFSTVTFRRLAMNHCDRRYWSMTIAWHRRVNVLTNLLLLFTHLTQFSPNCCASCWSKGYFYTGVLWTEYSTVETCYTSRLETLGCKDSMSRISYRKLYHTILRCLWWQKRKFKVIDRAWYFVLFPLTRYSKDFIHSANKLQYKSISRSAANIGIRF